MKFLFLAEKLILFLNPIEKKEVSINFVECPRGHDYFSPEICFILCNTKSCVYFAGNCSTRAFCFKSHILRHTSLERENLHVMTISLRA